MGFKTGFRLFDGLIKACIGDNRKQIRKFGSGLLALIWACFSSALPAFAGAWPLAPDEGQIISTTLYDTAKLGFNGDGEARDEVYFQKIDSAIYWEQGLTRKTTLVLQTSYQDIAFRSGVDNVVFRGLGESSAGLRHLVWKGETSLVSVQGTVIFGGPGELVTDADLGFGGTHGEIRLLYGKSFKFAGRDGFFDSQLGWRHRPDSAPDDVRFDISAGIRPTKSVQIIGQSFYTYGQGAKNIARENYRLKLQGSAVLDFKENMALQIGVNQTVAGRNVVKEKAAFIGVWQRF